jgi:plasmid maintenance system antidote protein VapI
MPRSDKARKLTKFGQFVVGNGVVPNEAAEEIGCSLGYFGQIMHDRESVSLRMAARIAVWARTRGLSYPIEQWEALGDEIDKLGRVRRMRPRPKPQRRTVFGRMLDDQGISFGRAASELGRSRQYLHMLATGEREVNLPMAVKIAAWAKRLGGDVPVESWPNVDFAMRAGARKD